ncbi:putative sensor histidine kinase pdtaS [Nymphon striatum]|nr:putative sensor histidine kinase pdtaS [Nymphon striatum]
MNATWQLLAESVLRDEADLHNAIHEKTVLLKEVHHRVKNNLQLIASILNMKMRKSKTPDIKAALNDIQQRVMSIARVHQKLYETSTEERVRADELLNSIVSQILDAAMLDKGEIQITQTYDPMVVYPDQAVPLTLAVSRACDQCAEIPWSA